MSTTNTQNAGQPAIAEPSSRAGARPALRLALRVPDEAARALGVGSDFFDERIRDELRLVRRGRLVFVAVAELEAWLDREGERVLEPRSSTSGGS